MKRNLLAISFCCILGFSSCNEKTNENNAGNQQASEIKTANQKNNNIRDFAGSWQGMTYGSGAYDPMFTMTIHKDGSWTDLTFGEGKKMEGKYRFNESGKTITLITAKGSDLYTFQHEPASAEHKERLVEVLPSNESYRAMVCYRYEVK